MVYSRLRRPRNLVLIAGMTPRSPTANAAAYETRPLSFVNGIARIGEDRIRYRRGVRHGAALATKLVEMGAEVWIADRQVGPARSWRNA